MICVMCGRPMLKAAVYAAGYPVGPKCAEKRGLLQVKSKNQRKKQKSTRFEVDQARRDDETIDMFGDDK